MIIKKTLYGAIFLLFSMLLSLHMSEAKSIRSQKLLIYYGYPSLILMKDSDAAVEANGNTEKAAQIFSQWDFIVLGANLELDEHDDHQNTAEIIEKVHQKNTQSKIFGYISIDRTIVNESIEKLQTRIEAWKGMGIDGIFLDNAGHDFQVSRERLNEVVRYIHTKKLSAFVNAWRIEDIMGNENEKSLLGKKDYYLLESFIINTDVYPKGIEPISEIIERIEPALKYRKTKKIKLMSIGMADYSAFSEMELQKFFHQQETAGLLFSLDGYGLAPTQFSASGEAANTVKMFSYSSSYERRYRKNPRFRFNPERTQIRSIDGSLIIE